MTREEKFTAALERLVARHPSLRLDVDWETGLAIVGCLQLALRHPANRGRSAATVRAFLDALIAHVGAVEPELAALLRLGDDPAHDQPR